MPEEGVDHGQGPPAGIRDDPRTRPARPVVVRCEHLCGSVDEESVGERRIRHHRDRQESDVHARDPPEGDLGPDPDEISHECHVVLGSDPGESGAAVAHDGEGTRVVDPIDEPRASRTGIGGQLGLPAGDERVGLRECVAGYGNPPLAGIAAPDLHACGLREAACEDRSVHDAGRRPAALGKERDPTPDVDAVVQDLCDHEVAPLRLDDHVVSDPHGESVLDVPCPPQPSTRPRVDGGEESCAEGDDPVTEDDRRRVAVANGVALPQGDRATLGRDLEHAGGIVVVGEEESTIVDGDRNEARGSAGPRTAVLEAPELRPGSGVESEDRAISRRHELHVSRAPPHDGRLVVDDIASAHPDGLARLRVEAPDRVEVPPEGEGDQLPVPGRAQRKKPRRRAEAVVRLPEARLVGELATPQLASGLGVRADEITEGPECDHGAFSGDGGGRQRSVVGSVPARKGFPERDPPEDLARLGPQRDEIVGSRRRRRQEQSPSCHGDSGVSRADRSPPCDAEVEISLRKPVARRRDAEAVGSTVSRPLARSSPGGHEEADENEGARAMRRGHAPVSHRECGGVRLRADSCRFVGTLL